MEKSAIEQKKPAIKKKSIKEETKEDIHGPRIYVVTKILIFKIGHGKMPLSPTFQIAN
jgi:hypothetical protein